MMVIGKNVCYWVSPRQTKTIFLQWLPWCLRMDRPGKKITRKTIMMNNRMKELELQERSSKSLLANVLDIDDDYRINNQNPNLAYRYRWWLLFTTPPNAPSNRATTDYSHFHTFCLKIMSTERFTIRRWAADRLRWRKPRRRCRLVERNVSSTRSSRSCSS